MNWRESAQRLEAWGAALALSLSVCICHGIGRFSYALILPAMQESERWSYELASWLNTANSIGAIAGALVSFAVLRNAPAGAVFRLGVVATVVSVFLTGVWNGWWWLVAMRVVSGWGAAFAFAAGGAIVAGRYKGDSIRSSLASGIYFAGGGLGMVISASIAPTLIAANGPSSWPAVWAVLGVVCALMGVLPYTASLGTKVTLPGSRAKAERSVQVGKYVLATMAYLLFAFAHTAYVFFVFAWAKTIGVPWHQATWMWVVLGLSVMASPFVWQHALKNWDPNKVLGAVCLQTCIGASLPLMSTAGFVLLLSAVLVGLAFFMAPAAIAILVRVSEPEPRWAIGIAAFSVFFSVGQAAGSWAAGVIADRASLTHTLTVGAGGLFVAAALAGFGRARPRAAASVPQTGNSSN